MAGQLIHLRRRIRSVRNTQKLTKAMKTVAAAKLRRANSELNRTRAYVRRLSELLQQVAGHIDPAAHPLLLAPAEGEVVLVAVSSDKGLCGAFNSHLYTQVESRVAERVAQGKKVSLVTVGNKGSRHLAKKGFAIRQAFPSLISHLSFAEAKKLSARLQEIYTDGGVARLEFVYTEFVSASRQHIQVGPLFPLTAAWTSLGDEEQEFIFEPSAEAIFDSLLPRYLDAQVYRLLLESRASEEAARMLAMDQATRNAGDMIGQLQLTLNKLRQAFITKELLEIMTATEALKK